MTGSFVTTSARFSIFKISRPSTSRQNRLVANFPQLENQRQRLFCNQNIFFWGKTNICRIRSIKKVLKKMIPALPEAFVIPSEWSIIRSVTTEHHAVRMNAVRDGSKRWAFSKYKMWEATRPNARRGKDYISLLHTAVSKKRLQKVNFSSALLSTELNRPSSQFWFKVVSTWSAFWQKAWTSIAWLFLENWIENVTTSLDSETKKKFAYKEITKITKLQSWDSARLRTQTYNWKNKRRDHQQANRSMQNECKKYKIPRTRWGGKLSDLMTGNHWMTRNHYNFKI